MPDHLLSAICQSLTHLEATSYSADHLGCIIFNPDNKSIYVQGFCWGPAGKSHTFVVDCPTEYTGKNFLCVARYDGIQVRAQWDIISGGQYATINEWGRVDIVSGTTNQYIIVRCNYGMYSEQKTILISYDNQLVITCQDVMRGTSGNAVALYNNSGCVPVWSITSGNEYATIDEYGDITILGDGTITIQAVYSGYTATKQVQLAYEANTTSETVINEDGSTTTTTTTTTTDPETGATTTESNSTTTNEDGSTSSTTEETTTNSDGSSTTTSETTNSDGTSSSTESSTSAPDPETGSTTTESTTTNYDENGDVSSSSETTSQQNTDGSSSSTTTNYNAEGDPTSGTNEEIDSDGNNSTQDIEYNDQGEPEVSGYTIDTSDNPDGEKTFDGDGVNTEFYGFDTTRGFVMHIHFTMDFTNQPANQDENHHQILTMKRATPEPWYGFQIRQTGTAKYIMLGTQFETGNNTNTQINPPRWIVNNKIAEYDIVVTYDPSLAANNFIAQELISERTVYQANNLFPDLPELRYLTVCIGYGLDANGDPYRYSNINIIEFSVTKLNPTLAEPVVTCNGQQIMLTCYTPNADIYYRLNQTGSYIQYTSPIDINTDTVIETYSELGSLVSETVTETCIYVPPHDYSLDYLTFRITNGGSIAWQAFGTGYVRTIEYSINDGAWTGLTSVLTNPATFPVSTGDVVRFRGTNSTYAGSKSNYSGFEGGTASFNIEGNIMSLINGDNFVGTSTLTGTYNFCSLFKKTKVGSAENLVMPMTTLTNYCCRAMFSLCTNLLVPPPLPATNLAQGCYWYMFEGCAITTAPDLLASTLVRECYGNMFTACGSLANVKCLATIGFGTTDCLTSWLKNVSAAGIFTKDASATSWPTGISGIPSGWTVHTE